jgi:uroporphyrinogen decarboxylase
MDKVQRISDALAGKPVDSVPYAVWTHLPEIDLSPELLAEETFRFYERHSLDFVKTMNNGMYAVEDFGCICDFSAVKRGEVATILKSPVEAVDDWENIHPASIQCGALARELHSLDLLLARVDGSAPVVMTVFSPLTIAAKMSQNRVLDHLRSNSTAPLHKALSAITETTGRLAERAIDLGASGVFFSTQLATTDLLSSSEYKEFGLPYDLRVFEKARKGWFNILHLHGNNIMFELVNSYPAQCFNWHIWETPPDIPTAKALTEKCLMGGIVRTDVTREDRAALARQIADAVKQSKKRRIILTPGCVVRHPLNHEVLDFIYETKISAETEFLD